MTANIGTDELTLCEVLRHATDGLFVIDKDRRVVFWSEGCARITGVEGAAASDASRLCYELTDCRDEQGRPLSGTLCPSAGVFAHEVSSARQRMSVKHRDGRRIWIETVYSPMFDDTGGVACVVGVMRDVTETMGAEARAGDTAIARDSGDSRETTTSLYCPGGGLADGSHAPLEEGTNAMGPLDRILTTIEKREILAALERANGQRTLAARLLGISRSRLYRRMEALDIDPRETGAAPEVHPREEA